MTQELTNPSLAALAFLIGEWDMAVSAASFLPDPDAVAHGGAELRPIEEGNLLAMRQRVDLLGPPAATWVIGRDESDTGFLVFYTDDRGVSRLYAMTFADRRWRMWRDDPAFSQRFEATISTDRNTIIGRWEKRASGGTWEHDFNVSYRRRF